MLYNPLGMGKPVRVQGCFISDSEVNSIIRFVKGTRRRRLNTQATL